MENINAENALEIQLNLIQMNNYIKIFVEGMAFCFTYGNINDSKFRDLRNDILGDAICFTTQILPFVKKTLSSLLISFDFAGSLSFPEFLECKDEVLSFGYSAEKKFGFLSDLIDTTDIVFIKREHQAHSLEFSNSEMELIEKTINQKQKELEETRRFNPFYLIPIVGVLFSLSNAMKSRSLLDEIWTKQEEFEKRKKAFTTIKINLIISIKAFSETVKLIKKNLSTLNTNTALFIEYCSKFVDQDIKKIQNQTPYIMFFKRIKDLIPQINKTIITSIQELDLMKNETEGLDMINRSNQINAEVRRMLFPTKDSNYKPKDGSLEKAIILQLIDLKEKKIFD